WTPPGVSSLPDITIAKGETNAVYVLNSKSDAELREWNITVLASAKVHGGELFVSSPLTRLELAAPYLTAKIETASCAPGRSTNVIVKLEQQIPFEGQATVKLLGLPEKVSVAEQHITRNDKEVVFHVEVDAACAPGSHRNLFCAVAVPKDGEMIQHRAGQGGVFRIVPAKKGAEAGPGAKKVAKNQ